jgi:urease accessory protein UreH
VIYGIHTRIQYPPNAESVYYKCILHHCIELQRVDDARFIYVDDGGHGRNSDGETFKASKFGRCF